MRLPSFLGNHSPALVLRIGSGPWGIGLDKSPTGCWLLSGCLIIIIIISLIISRRYKDEKN